VELLGVDVLPAVAEGGGGPAPGEPQHEGGLPDPGELCGGLQVVPGGHDLHDAVREVGGEEGGAALLGAAWCGGVGHGAPQAVGSWRRPRGGMT
jgi:hypothetical protein